MKREQELNADLAGSPSFDLENYVKRRCVLIETTLAQAVAAADGPASRLLEAMRYSLLAGGKRLRPILALAACEAVGGPPEAALGFACAIEMIHTYSLIHDDLPCMDDDDLRRGRPTNHKVYGEAIATLAGDGLLTDAFKILAASAMKTEGIAGATMLRVILELAEAAGSGGMVGGQVIDLLSEERTLTAPELESLHSKKTGALFVAAVVCGGLLGGARDDQVECLREYAKALGLAFQVVDDLLDVEATSDAAGKRTHKDHERGKATYPAILGIERSREFARELARRADQALAGFDGRSMPLRALATFAVERKT
jgi:geranylgeranyl diphosphate synthase type II